MPLTLHAAKVAYLVAFFVAFIPLRWHAPQKASEVDARYERYAEQIVTVVESEPPVFRNDPSTYGMTGALTLASLRTYEGGLNAWVEDGSCNDPLWRHEHRALLANGDCDGGRAFSGYQIHTEQGIVLLDDLTDRWGGVRFDAKGWSGFEIADDGYKSTRVAYRIVRGSILRSKSLCGYSGEDCSEGKHPKALKRMNRALDYLKEHPFVAPKTVVVVSP